MYSVYRVYKIYTDVLFKSIYPHAGYAAYFGFLSIEHCKKVCQEKT